MIVHLLYTAKPRILCKEVGNFRGSSNCFIAKTRVFKTHLTPPYHPERASAYASEGVEILLYTSSFRSGEVHIIKCF